jgi:hypothetical protein
VDTSLHGSARHLSHVDLPREYRRFELFDVIRSDDSAGRFRSLVSYGVIHASLESVSCILTQNA